jgi:hypothetical protein
MMVRMGENMFGVVKILHQGMCQGHFDICVENKEEQYRNLQGSHSDRFLMRYLALFNSG